MNPSPNEKAVAEIAEADPLATTRNEVLRRIGRNVWLFQGIEGQLKWLVHSSFAEGTAKTFAARNAERVARISRKTLGTLVGNLFEVTMPDEGPTSLLSGDETWMRFSLRPDQTSGFSEELRSDLAAIVAERNDLVHHAAQRWDLTSLASMQAALIELDGQRERILAVRAELARLIDSIKHAAREMLEYLESDEFRSQLHSVHLEACLLDAVVRASRSDDWTPLSHVGEYFRERVSRLSPEQQAALPKLHQLLRSSGLIDLSEEATAGGGTRLMCRLRTDRADAAGSPNDATVRAN